MKPFYSVISKFKDWQKDSTQNFCIKGVKPEEWSFILSHFWAENFPEQTQLILCPTQDIAENIYEYFDDNFSAVLYSGLGHSPYSSIISSENFLLQRISALRQIKSKVGPKFIIAPIEALNLLVADEQFLYEDFFEIKIDDIISPQVLAIKLGELGYSSSSSVEEPGTFSKKGEVFDIYPIGSNPIRLYYFDDLIEKIFDIDLVTQKTLKENIRGSVKIYASPHKLATDSTAQILRSKIIQPPTHFKNKIDVRKTMFESLQNGQLFENSSVFFPLFFNQPVSLLSSLPPKTQIHFLGFEECQKNIELLKEQWAQEHKAELDNPTSFNLVPEFNLFWEPKLSVEKFHSIYVERLNLNMRTDTDFASSLEINLVKITDLFLDPNHREKIQESKALSLLKIATEKLKYDGQLLFVYRSANAKSEVISYLESLHFDLSRVNFIQGTLTAGFIYKNEDLYVLSESDLYSLKSKKISKNKVSKTTDLFAEQISSLKNGDFVIHRDFGVGQYLGMESIQVGEQKSDFLVLLYEGGDKVYVPVYRLNLIQKHSGEHSSVRVASLKSKKFQEAKARAQQAIKKLAFDLIRLQAERKLKGGFSFSPPDHLYRDFELSFPFEETPDQEKAIQDVIDDMQSKQPMDRLVCGDVGFGKTEVAMRAAFKAVEDKKQVIVLVPTTVLALQHYHSFLKRFKEFPIHIDFLSRFKTPKDTKQVFQDVQDGKIDILIGTHKVLSENLHFKDLGLVIIDEEHRFGVNHKEKLKALKTSVDVLTLTATPIPRTLQLSFLGLRDLSLIRTAPPRRQSIKTYLVIHDDQTIKEAIEKELARGGQIFFVHNRVNDIEEVALYLKKLVPKLKITTTHGQMNERELEKRIEDFYQHKSDLLLTTTIIESGIDIPNANTMIIDRADTFGLAQLHQLRGRIGRSDRKAYAYFIVPAHRKISEIAERRLHSLQTYAEMGAGFSLASCDLEIRGAGDILGGEQSGHIESVGLELYMDLLQEAIHELKGENKFIQQNTEMQVPFNAYIPKTYIDDASLRLKYYKKLSNTESLAHIDELEDEMADIFGMLPRELNSLILILRSRKLLGTIGVKLLKISGSSIYLYFDQEILSRNAELGDKVLKFFMGKNKLYKINPDHSVVCYFKEAVSQDMLYEFSKHVAGQMLVC